MATNPDAPAFVFGANRKTSTSPRGAPADAGYTVAPDMTKLDELLANLNMKEGPEAVLRELKNRLEKFQEMSVNPMVAAAEYDEAVKHFERLALSSQSPNKKDARTDSRSKSDTPAFPFAASQRAKENTTSFTFGNFSSFSASPSSSSASAQPHAPGISSATFSASTGSTDSSNITPAFVFGSTDESQQPRQKERNDQSVHVGSEDVSFGPATFVVHPKSSSSTSSLPSASTSAHPLYRNPREGISTISIEKEPGSNQLSEGPIFRFGASKPKGDNSSAKRSHTLEEPEIFTFGHEGHQSPVAPQPRTNSGVENPEDQTITPAVRKKKKKKKSSKGSQKNSPKKRGSKSKKPHPPAAAPPMQPPPPTADFHRMPLRPPAFGGTIPDMGRGGPADTGAVAGGTFRKPVSQFCSQKIGSVSTHDISDGIKAMEIDDSDVHAAPTPESAAHASTQSTPSSSTKFAPRASTSDASGNIFVFGSPEHVPLRAQHSPQSEALPREATSQAGLGGASATRRRSKKNGSSSAKKRSRKLYGPKHTSANKYLSFKTQAGAGAGNSVFTAAPNSSEIPRVFSSFQEIAQQYQAPDISCVNSAGQTGGEGVATAAASFIPSAPVPLPQRPPLSSHQVQSDALKQRGNIKYNEGDYVGAVKLYSQAIQVSPTIPTYLLNRSAALIQLQRFSDAVEDSNRATEMDRTLVKGYLRAGRSLIAMGRASDAREQFQRCCAVEQAPSMKPDMFEKIQAEARNEILRVQAYETGMRECISLLLQAGANPRGRKSDRKRRSSRPTDVDRRANRILAQEALKLSNRATVIATWSIEPVRLKIIAMIAMGTLDSLTDSIDLCDFELRQRRQRSIVRLEDLVLGRDLSSSTPDESMRLAVANDIAILSLLRGRALHLCGDIPGSESALRSANIALRNELALCNPDMPRPGGHRQLMQAQAELLEEQRLVREMQARRECGNTEFRNVKYAKAYDAYSGALNLDPSHDSYNAILYCNRAAALMMLGLFTEAVADCDEALKRHSYYPKARQRRANALRSAGQLAGAQSELDRLRSEMKRRGHHKQTPRTGLDRLFGVDYRTVEQEYNEILVLLASEQERKSKNRSRASYSSGYSQPNSRSERRYGRSYRSNSTGSNTRSSGRSGGDARSSGYRKQYRQSYGNTSSTNAPAPRRNEDPYTILGVRRGDGAAKIKKAYHKLALKYHPDKLKSSSMNGGEDPAEVFKRINEAYSKVQEELGGGSRASSFRGHRSSF